MKIPFFLITANAANMLPAEEITYGKQEYRNCFFFEKSKFAWFERN